MISRKHSLIYDELVVGATIQALRFAKLRNLPLVSSESEPLHRFHKDFDQGEFARLWFLLSMSGKTPLGQKADSLKLLPESNQIKASTSSGFLFIIEYQKIYLFSDIGVSGLPSPVETAEDLYEVVDWINVRSGMSHEHDRIESTSDFVKCVRFYPTERLDGHHPTKKDAAAISYMTKEQLRDPAYSDYYVRFKTEELMRAAGIKGQSCGESNYALKIESSHREVFPVFKNKYKNTDSIEFMND